DSHGFSDLLERLQFARRIQQQDASVVKAVRASRRAVAAEAIRLGALQLREQNLAAQILAERNWLEHTSLALNAQRRRLLQVRSVKASQLASARAQLDSLQNELSQLRAAQERAAAALAAQQAASQQAASTEGSSGTSGAGAPATSGASSATPSGSGSATPSGSGSAA